MAIHLLLLSIYCSIFSTFVTSVSAADDEDPFDLSFYTKGAAIGDSYTAGIGAGNEENWSCSRYDGSYASLVSLQLGVDRNKLDFTYTACSGAVVDDISKQARALSSGQEFVIMSAGGNDAKLSDILNSCVYSFYGGLSHPSCEKVLEASRSIIEGDQFAAKLDELIELVKSKLTPDGNIYYAGYAKFFDATDNTCDKVSWHVWLNLFTREYLTKDRREKMNSLVEAMNTALSSAVQRAGPQVHFIDYDNDVGVSRGRYCQPGQDENSGRGANLEDLFFYEMKSLDSPWLEIGDAIYHDELKRSLIEEDDVLPTNDTLGGMYGALMQKAIDESVNDGQDGYAAVQDDNGNIEIEDEVKDVESSLLKRSASLLKPGLMRLVNRSENTTISWNATQNPDSDSFSAYNASQGPVLGSKVSLGNAHVSSSFIAGHTNMHFANTTASTNGSAMGTVIANRTHVLFGNKAVARINIKKLFVGDDTSRVFHPTQGGHALIANMILYQMAADNARRLGIDSIPPMISNTTGDDWPELPGAACNQDSTDTWAGRDAMISAVKDFCADPHNTRGSKGDLTSATFGSEFDYMNVSISWESDNDAVISEHGCSTWLDIVTDGCNVPRSGQSNDKHGGLIEYTNTKLNATMKIEPLVMRKIWDGGQAGGQQCNGIDTNNYLDQETLASNIEDFCAKSAAQNVADSDSTFSQVFNDGTPDQVELSTQWPNGERNYEVFKEECLYYMSVINNGCSLPGDDNKMNWKHGGSISDNNNILYKISPTQSRPPPPSAPFGSCKAPLLLPGPHYAVSITGGGFSNSDDGAALRREFNNCGARSALTFNYLDTPAEDGTEWTAYAELPLLIPSHCAQRAIRRVGGFVNNQC